jgi:hypothetical protein
MIAAMLLCDKTSRLTQSTLRTAMPGSVLFVCEKMKAIAMLGVPCQTGMPIL